MEELPTSQDERRPAAGRAGRYRASKREEGKVPVSLYVAPQTREQLNRLKTLVQARNNHETADILCLYFAGLTDGEVKNLLMGGR